MAEKAKKYTDELFSQYGMVKSIVAKIIPALVLYNPSPEEELIRIHKKNKQLLM